MSASQVVSAIALAPTVISGLQTIASDVSTDIADHKSVVATGADALGAAVTSLNTVARSNIVSNNDASNIESGIAFVGEAAALASEAGALIAKLKVWVSKI